jgi:hypothetical protein
VILTYTEEKADIQPEQLRYFPRQLYTLQLAEREEHKQVPVFPADGMAEATESTTVIPLMEVGVPPILQL